jgi:hypothetical protein
MVASQTTKMVNTVRTKMVLSFNVVALLSCATVASASEIGKNHFVAKLNCTLK